MPPAEWTSFTEGLSRDKIDELSRYIAFEEADAVKSVVGIEVYKVDWAKENKYLLIPYDGDSRFRKIDPLTDS